MMSPEEMKVVRPFLDDEGRLRQYPVKQSKKLSALHYLAEKFEEGRSYTEKEVNAILNEWHTFGDPCMLRRAMYDAYLLDRERDGTDYRRHPQETGPGQLPAPGGPRRSV